MSQIEVITLSGKRISLKIGIGIKDSNHSILDLKIQIQNLEGFPIEAQRLIFYDQQLRNEKTIKHYNIKKGNTLYLVLVNSKQKKQETECIDLTIQGIYYLNKRTHRIKQNIFGQCCCPLIALCNTLSLQHRFLKFDFTKITAKGLRDSLLDHLDINTFSLSDNNDTTNIRLKDYYHDIHISQSKHLFSASLQKQLQINPKFTDCNEFEENSIYNVFEEFGIKLYHGFVVNPKHDELFKLIGNKSYEEVMNFMLVQQENNDKKIIQDFIENYSAQLTPYGLERLYTLIDVEDELAVLWHNNHFSTIMKHQGILYRFVTDESIIDADPQITWQTILQLSGDEQFVNNKFQSIWPSINQQTQIDFYNAQDIEEFDSSIDFTHDTDMEHEKMQEMILMHSFRINRVVFGYTRYIYQIDMNIPIGILQMICNMISSCYIHL